MMTRLIRSNFALIALFVWAGSSWAGTITGNVADYNAAKVQLAGGMLTVPAGVATYQANSTLAIGSSFTVTLPAGMTFSSAPALTTSGTATFALAGGGIGAQSASFTVATANVTSGQTITLASFTLAGATALETVTPVANALPLTMQAIGTDASPLPFKAFASDPGVQAVFVGAIQFIDTKPPSNATEFGTGTNDSHTAVLAAIEISPQLTDAAAAVPVLNPNGTPNTISPTDTATVSIGGNFADLDVFVSTNSNCLSSILTGTAGFTSATFKNVPFVTEEFFCATSVGGIYSNVHGYSPVTVSPGSSTDFLSANAVNEFPGVVCYFPSTVPGHTCDLTYVLPGVQNATPVPALSEWCMVGMAAMVLIFGIWKLKARPITDSQG